MNTPHIEVEFVRKVDHNEYDYLRESHYRLVGESGAISFLLLRVAKPWAISQTRLYLYPMGLDLSVHSRAEQPYWDRSTCDLLGVCWLRQETGLFITTWTKTLVTPQATDEDIFVAMLEHYRRVFRCQTK